MTRETAVHLYVWSSFFLGILWGVSWIGMSLEEKRLRKENGRLREQVEEKRATNELLWERMDDLQAELLRSQQALQARAQEESFR